MKKTIGIIVCFLAILVLAPRARANAAESALLFPVEYTTNKESKAWSDNKTRMYLSVCNDLIRTSKNMMVSYDLFVPQSLMAKRGFSLTLASGLNLNDEKWNWLSDANAVLETTVSKKGSGYSCSFYDIKKKKNIKTNKYVTIRKVGKYVKISVKKMPVSSPENKKRRIEFVLAVVGNKKAEAMLYIDNVKVHNGSKTIASDSFNKNMYYWAELNDNVKDTLLYTANFNKNRIPAYEKVPDDIRNASTKRFVSRTSKKASTSTINKATKDKAKKMPTATCESLPAWHGMNLTTWIEYGWNEETHRIPYFTKALVDEIAKQGFNFLRVTIDSRIVYSKVMTNGAGQYFKGDDKKVNLNVLKNLDDMITWCINKNIHVCLDCHTTPGGYMIGGDEEASRELLFTDGSKEQQYFYHFWDLLAKRYKGISSNAVSFDLYNEPPTFATDEQYSKMMKKVISSVHKIDPNRLLFVDMLDYGKKPVQGLVGEKIVQASHIYDPYDFTHSNYDLLEHIKRGLKNYDTVSYDYDLYHAALVKRMEEIRQFREETGTLVMLQEFGTDNYIKIEDLVKYYDDILSLAKEYDLPWANWDYEGGTFGHVNTLETERIPGAHYQKIGVHRYIAKEVKEVMQKYMND